MIRVLIVEDSAVERELLINVLSSDKEIQIVGIVGDGEAAIRAVAQLKPDVVTMDIIMPKLSGIEATRQIMQNTPTPIVIVTNSYEGEETLNTYKAIEAGALAVVKKPAGMENPNHGKESATLISYLKLMSEIKVIRRFGSIPLGKSKQLDTLTVKGKIEDARIVAIGASTGGPAVLEKILSGLPKDFSLPIVVVQHMAPGFIGSFAKWLETASGFRVRIAEQGDYLEPGVAYFAPDDFHLTVESNRIHLTKDLPDKGLRPSVSHLLKSVVQHYGKNAIGIILTGMGSDGAYEMKLMRDAGAVTIAQDSISSVVFGMPGEAVKLGGAEFVLAPEAIVDAIGHLKKIVK